MITAYDDSSNKAGLVNNLLMDLAQITTFSTPKQVRLILAMDVCPVPARGPAGLPLF